VCIRVCVCACVSTFNRQHNIRHQDAVKCLVIKRQKKTESTKKPKIQSRNVKENENEQFSSSVENVD